MKRKTIMISFLLMLTPLIVSALPFGAESVTSLDDEIVVSAESKISSELLEKWK